jgi:hypothetical protein
MAAYVGMGMLGSHLARHFAEFSSQETLHICNVPTTSSSLIPSKLAGIIP